MNDQPVLRIVLAAAVVGLFYGVLFTGRAPASASRPSGELAAERAKRLVEESRTLRREKAFAAALAPARQLHDAFPSSPIYIDQLADVYHHLDRFAEEAALLEEFLVKAPHPEEGCPRIGLAYRALRRDAEAFGAFKRCYELDPTDPDAILYFALANERAGRTDDAAKLYREGLARAPEYDDLSLGLARTLLRQGHVEKAKAAAVAVLAKHPDNTDALLVAGLACVRSGQPDLARQYFERGVRLAPNNSEILEALARIK